MAAIGNTGFSSSGLPVSGKRTTEEGQALLRELGFREAVLEPDEHWWLC